MKRFSNMKFQHIPKERNQLVDHLAGKGLNIDVNLIIYNNLLMFWWTIWLAHESTDRCNPKHPEYPMEYHVLLRQPEPMERKKWLHLSHKEQTKPKHISVGSSTSSRVSSPHLQTKKDCNTNTYNQMEPPTSQLAQTNSDASGTQNLGTISFGGIIRDDKGKWVQEYCGNIGYNTVNYGDLWGIYKGILLTVDLGIK